MTKEDLQTQKDIFLKPNIESFDLNALRARRNLITLSVATLIYIHASNGVDFGSSTLFGLNFFGLKPEILHLFTLTALAFLFIHFIWIAIDHYNSSKHRLTGPKPYIAKSASMADGIDISPNTNNAMDSTIYSWWSKQEGILLHLEKIKDNLDRKEPSNEKKINDITEYMESFKIIFETTSDAIEKFDSSFWKHQKSQMFRFMVFEYGLPIGLGAAAIIQSAARFEIY